VAWAPVEHGARTEQGEEAMKLTEQRGDGEAADREKNRWCSMVAAEVDNRW
jgi:hypothetical protein